MYLPEHIQGKHCPQLHQSHSTEVHELRQMQKKAGLGYSLQFIIYNYANNIHLQLKKKKKEIPT